MSFLKGLPLAGWVFREGLDSVIRERGLIGPHKVTIVPVHET